MCVCGPEYQKHDYLKFLIFRNCINFFQDSIRIFENLVPHVVSRFLKITTPTLIVEYGSFETLRASFISLFWPIDSNHERAREGKGERARQNKSTILSSRHSRSIVFTRLSISSRVFVRSPWKLNQGIANVNGIATTTTSRQRLG